LGKQNPHLYQYGSNALKVQYIIIAKAVGLYTGEGAQSRLYVKRLPLIKKTSMKSVYGDYLFFERNLCVAFKMIGSVL